MRPREALKTLQVAFRAGRLFVALSLIALLLQSCDRDDTQVEAKGLGDGDLLMLKVGAERRAVIIEKRGSQLITCAEPAPDIAENVVEALKQTDR